MEIQKEDIKEDIDLSIEKPKRPRKPATQKQIENLQKGREKLKANKAKNTELLSELLSTMKEPKENNNELKKPKNSGEIDHKEE